MILDVLRERIQCRFPLLFLTTWEEERWESEITSLALDMDRSMVTWTATEGASPPVSATEPLLEADQFLQQVIMFLNNNNNKAVDQEKNVTFGYLGR